MGDADNALPPSKKRAAGRELSRDNPGLDDEEEIPGQETGTFKRASEEVLANRRIVKVRRSQTSSAPSAPSAPSSNPFASIRLVPPAATPAAVNVPEEIAKTGSEEAESPKSVNKESEKLELGEKEGASEVRKPEPKVADSEAGKETEKNVLEGNDEKGAEKETEKNVLEGNDEKGTEKNLLEGNNEKNVEEPEKGTQKKSLLEGDSEKNVEEAEKGTENEAKKESVNSFQQLSSSQNAFTGIVGTGFSSSTFSFGSISKTDPPSFPSFSFGTNGNSALFGNPPGGEKTEGTKIPSMQEVHVETGEENEMAVFTADAALFEFLDGGWKERGKGELKVNVLTTGTKKARLVMRARGNYRLILNASIFPDMKLTNMEKKGITFACLNSTGEGQNGLSTFALKFKDAAIVDEFRSVVTEHKGSAVAVQMTVQTTIKTPENSPKASDE